MSSQDDKPHTPRDEDTNGDRSASDDFQDKGFEYISDIDVALEADKSSADPEGDYCTDDDLYTRDIPNTPTAQVVLFDSNPARERCPDCQELRAAVQRIRYVVIVNNDDEPSRLDSRPSSPELSADYKAIAAARRQRRVDQAGARDAVLAQGRAALARATTDRSASTRASSSSSDEVGWTSETTCNKLVNAGRKDSGADAGSSASSDSFATRLASNEGWHTHYRDARRLPPAYLIDLLNKAEAEVISDNAELDSNRQAILQKPLVMDKYFPKHVISHLIPWPDLFNSYLATKELEEHAIPERYNITVMMTIPDPPRERSPREPSPTEEGLADDEGFDGDDEDAGPVNGDQDNTNDNDGPSQTTTNLQVGQSLQHLPGTVPLRPFTSLRRLLDRRTEPDQIFSRPASSNTHLTGVINGCLASPIVPGPPQASPALSNDAEDGEIGNLKSITSALELLRQRVSSGGFLPQSRFGSGSASGRDSPVGRPSSNEAQYLSSERDRQILEAPSTSPLANGVISASSDERPLVSPDSDTIRAVLAATHEKPANTSSGSDDSSLSEVNPTQNPPTLHVTSPTPPAPSATALARLSHDTDPELLQGVATYPAPSPGPPAQISRNLHPPAVSTESRATNPPPVYPEPAAETPRALPPPRIVRPSTFLFGEQTAEDITKATAEDREAIRVKKAEAKKVKKTQKKRDKRRAARKAKDQTAEETSAPDEEAKEQTTKEAEKQTTGEATEQATEKIQAGAADDEQVRRTWTRMHRTSPASDPLIVTAVESQGQDYPKAILDAPPPKHVAAQKRANARAIADQTQLQRYDQYQEHVRELREERAIAELERAPDADPDSPPQRSQRSAIENRQEVLSVAEASHRFSAQLGFDRTLPPYSSASRGPQRAPATPVLQPRHSLEGIPSATVTQMTQFAQPKPLRPEQAIAVLQTNPVDRITHSERPETPETPTIEKTCSRLEQERTTPLLSRSRFTPVDVSIGLSPSLANELTGGDPANLVSPITVMEDYTEVEEAIIRMGGEVSNFGQGKSASPTGAAPQDSQSPGVMAEVPRNEEEGSTVPSELAIQESPPLRTEVAELTPAERRASLMRVRRLSESGDNDAAFRARYDSLWGKGGPDDRRGSGPCGEVDDSDDQRD